MPRGGGLCCLFELKNDVILAYRILNYLTASQIACTFGFKLSNDEQVNDERI